MDEKKVMDSEKCAESKRPAMSEERKFAILFWVTRFTPSSNRSFLALKLLLELVRESS
jgi:hypothetical protein